MADAAAETGTWVARMGFGRAQQDGMKAAAQESWKQVKGGGGIAFKRVGATGVGLVMAGDAIFRSKSDGEDRSGLVRVGEFVLGTGMAAAGVLAGKGR